MRSRLLFVFVAVVLYFCIFNYGCLFDWLFVIVYSTAEELAKERETGEYTSGFHYEFSPFHKIREYFDQAR